MAARAESSHPDTCSQRHAPSLNLHGACCAAHSTQLRACTNDTSNPYLYVEGEADWTWPLHTKDAAHTDLKKCNYLCTHKLVSVLSTQSLTFPYKYTPCSIESVMHPLSLRSCRQQSIAQHKRR